MKEKVELFFYPFPPFMAGCRVNFPFTLRRSLRCRNRTPCFGDHVRPLICPPICDRFFGFAWTSYKTFFPKGTWFLKIGAATSILYSVASVNLAYNFCISWPIWVQYGVNSLFSTFLFRWHKTDYRKMVIKFWVLSFPKTSAMRVMLYLRAKLTQMLQEGLS
jgi:hypothetical protein